MAESSIVNLFQAILVGIITGVFSAGAVWGVLKTELRWLRRDVDMAHERLTRHEDHCHPERKMP